jgi:hypothetical protein
MGDSIEQVKQEVAELIAAQYPVQAIRDVLMTNFQNAPLAGTVEYWVDIKNSMIKQKTDTASPQANDQDKGGTEGDFKYEQSEDGKGVIIGKYTGIAAAVQIPSQMGGKPVVGIGKRSFESEALRNVTIPDSVTFIAERAFCYCEGLTGVIMGNGVKTIGENAFSGNKIASLVIGDGVETIGKCAFERNEIAELTLGKSVVSIDECAFNKNKNLNSLIIPDSVKSIGKEAFAQGSFEKDAGLKSLTIGSGVTNIGQDAFRRNQLTRLIIPNNVKTIARQAFGENPLAHVVIPDEIDMDIAFGTTGDVKTKGTYIIISSYYDWEQANPQFTKSEDFLWEKTKDGKSAVIFKYKGKDAEVNIPTQIWGLPVTEIESFNRATEEKKKVQITSVTIPDCVTTVGDLSGCGLADVTIGKGVKTIKNRGFSNNKLTKVSIPEGVTSIEEASFANNQLTSITIPPGVTVISRNVFEGNQLTSVNIPKGVTKIDWSAFSNNQLASITIPDSVTFIGRHAFQNNKLKNVTIPDSVTEIEQDAFAVCPLVSVTIGGKVNLPNLEIITSMENGEIYMSSFSSLYRNYFHKGNAAGTYTRPNVASDDWKKE